MHRAETIMQTVQTLLTGLATTGASVQRSRIFPSLTLPALTIAQGDNNGLAQAGIDGDENDIDSVTRSLQVNITAHIAEATTMETTLNQVATEVFAALMADRTLGLAYVFDVVLLQDDEPDISKSPTVSQRMSYAVVYEHSNTSTES